MEHSDIPPSGRGRLEGSRWNIEIAEHAFRYRREHIKPYYQKYGRDWKSFASNTKCWDGILKRINVKFGDIGINANGLAARLSAIIRQARKARPGTRSKLVKLCCRYLGKYEDIPLTETMGGDIDGPGEDQLHIQPFDPDFGALQLIQTYNDTPGDEELDPESFYQKSPSESDDSVFDEDVSNPSTTESLQNLKKSVEEVHAFYKMQAIEMQMKFDILEKQLEEMIKTCKQRI